MRGLSVAVAIGLSACSHDGAPTPERPGSAVPRPELRPEREMDSQPFSGDADANLKNPLFGLVASASSRSDAVSVSCPRTRPSQSMKISG